LRSFSLPHQFPHELIEQVHHVVNLIPPEFVQMGHQQGHDLPA
jgi:hypothetical protein